MNNYNKLLELIKICKKNKYWKYIKSNTIFQIEGFKPSIFISITGNIEKNKSIIIFQGRKELITQLEITYGAYLECPDNYLRLSSYRIDLGKSFIPYTIEEKELLNANNIKYQDLVYRFNPGKYPRLATEKECLFLIKIVKKIILILDYYIKNKLESKTLQNGMYSFNVKNEVTHRIKKFNFNYEFPIQNKLENELVQKTIHMNKRNIVNMGLYYSPIYVTNIQSFPLIIILYDNVIMQILDIIFIGDKDYKNISNIVLESLIDKNIIPEYMSFNTNESLVSCAEIINTFDIKHRVINDTNLNNIWHDIRHNLIK